MSIPYDKNFLLTPGSRSSVMVKVSFQGHTRAKCKVFTMDITFEWYDLRPSYLTCESNVKRPFYSLQVQGHKSKSNIKVTVFESLY